MFLKGALADLMVNVAPIIYRKYVIVSSEGKLLLYSEIKKGVAWPTMHHTTVLQESGEIY